MIAKSQNVEEGLAIKDISKDNFVNVIDHSKILSLSDLNDLTQVGL